MSRSLKKGPFIDVKLEKRVLAMNESNKKSVVKTWARYSMISPDFVGHTINFFRYISPKIWWDINWENLHRHVPLEVTPIKNKRD